MNANKAGNLNSVLFVVYFRILENRIQCGCAYRACQGLTTLLTRFCGVQKQSIMPSKNRSYPSYSEVHMLGTLLIIILILGLVGAFPRWGYSRDWGYWPSGGLGLVLLVVLVLVLMGRI